MVVNSPSLQQEDRSCVGGQCLPWDGAHWPGKKGICCRSESGLVCVSETPRSSVGKIPAGADTHFSSQVHPPPSPDWREMPGGFTKNQRRRKGWGLNCTWYSQSSSALCISLSCLKASIYLFFYIFIYTYVHNAIRSHLKQFPEQPTAISRKTDKHSQ